MEGLNPTLKLLLFFKCGIENGQSVRHLIEKYGKECQDATADQLLCWWLYHQDKRDLAQKAVPDSRYLRSLFILLEKSLTGASILPSLVILEQDLWLAINDELDNYLVTLPFKLLIPLLLLQFPAIMLLILGPLLQQIMNSL